jgi:hypothetical protein
MHPTCPPPCYRYQERVSDLSSSAACGDEIKLRSDINWSAWLSRPAEDVRTTNAACVHVRARSSRPCRSSSVSARVAQMVASLAYFQNSSVCDMAHPSCAPTRPDCHAASLGSGSLVKSAHIGRAASNPSTAKAARLNGLNYCKFPDGNFES